MAKVPDMEQVRAACAALEHMAASQLAERYVATSVTSKLGFPACFEACERLHDPEPLDTRFGSVSWASASSATHATITPEKLAELSDALQAIAWPRSVDQLVTSLENVFSDLRTCFTKRWTCKGGYDPWHVARAFLDERWHGVFRPAMPKMLKKEYLIIDCVLHWRGPECPARGKKSLVEWLEIMTTQKPVKSDDVAEISQRPGDYFRGE
jgi:hypothetical protein